MSSITANPFARHRERRAPGNCRKARRIPLNVVRTGLSTSKLKAAPVHEKTRCPASRRQSWMFFQTNNRKFFLRTESMYCCENLRPMVPRCSCHTLLAGS